VYVQWEMNKLKFEKQEQQGAETMPGAFPPSFFAGVDVQ